MARQARLHVPGGLYHIALRGSGNDPIFRTPEDRKMFEQLTARSISVCGAHIHAYCWLPTEAHFALEVGCVRSGAVMQRICGPFARYARRKYGLAEVFQSRYQARLVDRDLHLLALVRHITRLPLSTAENLELDRYPWSSHIFYLGLGRRECPWLRTDDVWEALSWRGTDAERAYRKLIEAPHNADEVAMLARGSKTGRRASGSMVYLEWLGTRPHRRATSLTQILDAVAIRVDVAVDVMCSPSRQRRPSLARALAAWHAFRAGIASWSEVARQFDRDPSSIGDAIEFYRSLEPELFNESLEELLSWARSMPLEDADTTSSTHASRHSLSPLHFQRPARSKREQQ